MIDEINNIRSIVKREILNKNGQGVNYAKDCQFLSDSIFKETNRQLSVSTLKRFFGIINTPFHPSKYTLDTIAIYLNFKNWDDFQNALIKNKMLSVEPSFWERLKNRIQVVTNESLNSIKAKIGDQFVHFLAREFAVKKMMTFLESHQTATAFIAPGGYGKSTVIAQLTEIFFTGENAKYPNDIVCLIDGSILINLVDLNLEMVRMKNVVNFDPENSFSVYFRKNPDQVNGRFILIVESLYEIYYKEDKLTHFVENLMDIIASYKDFKWFKLVITCRPEDWKIFTNIIQKNPGLKSQWFDVNFSTNMIDTINIPLLTNNEIKYYLEKKHSDISFNNLKFHFPEITEIINNPYLLQLYNLSQNPTDVHSDLELLIKFIYSKVLTEPYLEEKSIIIDSFFKISDYAKQNTSVKKNDLPTFPFFNLAYKELIFNNILYEYTTQGDYLSVITYVKFSNDIIMGFFLANKWMEENKFDLDLFKRVFIFYKYNIQLQTTILKYLIKFAFKENNTDILKDIYTIFESEKDLFSLPEKSNVNPEIINTIGVELRKNKKLREFLVPYYAKSKLGQLYYFESFFDMDSLVLHSGDNIDFYLENKHSDEAVIYGHFLKFMQYFLATDNKNCKHEYELFQKMVLPENSRPVLAGYFYGAQVIFQSFFLGKVDPKLMSIIYKKADFYFETGIVPKSVNPIFEHVIIYSLNYGDKFEEICRLMELMLSRFEMVGNSCTWHNQLSKIIYARALLNMGKTEQALKLYQQSELKVVPENYKNYVKIRFNLVKVEFLIFLKKYREAKILIEEIKTLTQIIRHKFLHNKALLLESKLY